jgi:hypothetical protein
MCSKHSLLSYACEQRSVTDILAVKYALSRELCRTGLSYWLYSKHFVLANFLSGMKTERTKGRVQWESNHYLYITGLLILHAFYIHNFL